MSLLYILLKLILSLTHVISPTSPVQLPAECTVASCKASWIWHPGCSVASSCQRSICYQAQLPPGYCSRCWFWKMSNSNSANSEWIDWRRATCLLVRQNIWDSLCRLIGMWLTLWQGFRFPSTLQLPACRAWKPCYSPLHLTCPHSHPLHYTAEFEEYSGLRGEEWCWTAFINTWQNL